jgi:antitoxin component YwqK of YwqJK toxin-antitoxin module
MSIDLKDNLASNSLVERNGLLYEVNSETPFTGIANKELISSDPNAGPTKYADQKTNYKNGLKDGLEVITHLDGNRDEIYYKKGLQDGLKVNFFQGSKSTECRYKNGVLDGRYICWHLNGQKYSEVNYVNGEREGLEVEWHNNGQKSSEKNYVNGKLDGLEVEWNKKGEKIREVHHKESWLNKDILFILFVISLIIWFFS